MIKHFVLLLFLFISLVSCETILTNNTSKQNKKSITAEPIDFTNVDAYPLLPACEKYTSRIAQKECFYQLLSKRIELSLIEKNIMFSSITKDTIKVTIQVSSKGIVSVKAINNFNNKEFKIAIIKSLETLPKIQPAIKAGIPVTTEFVLPIILRSVKIE